MFSRQPRRLPSHPPPHTSTAEPGSNSGTPVDRAVAPHPSTWPIRRAGALTGLSAQGQGNMAGGISLMAFEGTNQVFAIRDVQYDALRAPAACPALPYVRSFTRRDPPAEPSSRLVTS
ncbi:hypothetical protein ACIRVF_33435 [Kitasatospora sp. NPDC101157]|uniref:hypothetical protein n=1 Tax=Kitasatospora sp. NPDC101157 TaxID=3364098 RepID=UPI00380231BB